MLSEKGEANHTAEAHFILKLKLNQAVRHRKQVFPMDRWSRSLRAPPTPKQGDGHNQTNLKDRT
jgi:hypothetical protein